MGPREEGGRGGALFTLPKGIYCQQDLSLLMLTLATWPGLCLTPFSRPLPPSLLKHRPPPMHCHWKGHKYKLLYLLQNKQQSKSVTWLQEAVCKSCSVTHTLPSTLLRTQVSLRTVH